MGFDHRIRSIPLVSHRNLFGICWVEAAVVVRKDVYGHPALSPPVAAATGSGSKRALPPRAPRARARLRASRAPTGCPQSRWWKKPAESAHCQQELEQKPEEQVEGAEVLEGATVVQEAAKSPHNTPEPAARARASAGGARAAGTGTRRRARSRRTRAPGTSPAGAPSPGRRSPACRGRARAPSASTARAPRSPRAPAAGS